MASASPPPTAASGSSIPVLLIASQPLLRLGLRMALAASPGVTIVLELERADQAIALDLTAVALVLVQWTGDRPERQLLDLERLVRQGAADRPTDILPLLVVGDLPSGTIESLKRSGVRGVCSPDIPPETLIAIVDRLAQGDCYWPVATPSGSAWSRLQGSGLAQIEAHLADLAQQRSRSSRWTRLWLDGQMRELRAARWLLQRPTQRRRSAQDATGLISSDRSGTLPANRSANRPANRAGTPGQLAAVNALTLGNARGGRSDLVGGSSRVPSRSTWDLLVIRTRSLLTPNLVNLSQIPLELEALTPQRRQELLSLVLEQISQQIEHLRQSRWSDVEASRGPAFVQRCWQDSLTEFYGPYATLPTAEGPVNLVSRLLDQGPIVEGLLRSIEGTDDLLGLLLDQQSPTIDGRSYPLDSSETLARSEQYLHNLLLHLANAVVYPLLNQFPEHPLIQQYFWEPRLFATRDIERFRNSLSWYYRVSRFIQEPRDIYESRHWLLTLEPGAIQRRSIYAPRRRELAQLSALQQGLALTIELQDALAPHLRRLVRWLGTVVVYLLTQIVGRGLGLIGRGILQGIGQSFGERSVRQ
jgi:DNA-binding NarL/FixJ family response regulator